MKKLFFTLSIIVLFTGSVLGQSAGVASGFAQRGGGIEGLTFDGEGIVFGSPADSVIFEIPASFESTISITTLASTSFLAYDTDSDSIIMKPSGFSATNSGALGAIMFQVKDGEGTANLFAIDSTGQMTTQLVNSFTSGSLNNTLADSLDVDGEGNFEDGVTVGNDAANVSGIINFIASDNDKGNIAITTGDRLDISGFGAGVAIPAAGTGDASTFLTEANGGANANMVSYGSTATGTWFGVNKADMSTILFNGATNNTIGSIDNVPLIFGVNNTTQFTITSGLATFVGLIDGNGTSSIADNELADTLNVAGQGSFSTGISVGEELIYVPNALSNAGTSVADDAAITVTNTIMRMVGADAEAVLDTDPAVNDGSTDGQIVIIQGTADGNLVTIADNVNTQLAGGVSMTLGDGDVLCLMWDSNFSMWIEQYRSDN